MLSIWTTHMHIRKRLENQEKSSKRHKISQMGTLFPEWLWASLSQYLSISDAVPLLRTSSKRPHLLCLSHKSQNLWNPAALKKMTISTLLDRKCTPTPFACRLTELIQAIGVGYDDGKQTHDDEKQTQGDEDEAMKEIFQFYLWFQLMPHSDVHVCCPDGEHVPPSQYKTALQAKEKFVSCMWNSTGRRQDNIYDVCETPFKMFLLSGILDTDLEFGTKVEGRREPGHYDVGTPQRGTTEEIVTYLKRLHTATDIALVFRIHADFALVGGDGSMRVTLGYISIRGTLVLLRRSLCEYPPSRYIWYKEWDISNPNNNLPLIFDEISKLLTAKNDEKWKNEEWDIAYGDNSILYDVHRHNTLINCPGFPQYEIAEKLIESAKQHTK